jgi:hypothetical protein
VLQVVAIIRIVDFREPCDVLDYEGRPYATRRNNDDGGKVFKPGLKEPSPRRLLGKANSG